MGMEKGGVGARVGMGSKLHLSVITFILMFVMAVGVSILALVLNNRKAAADAPQLALNSLMKSVLAHQKQEGRFPKDFAELEFNIWNKKNAGAPSRLFDGKTLFLDKNYLYVYYGEAQTCAIWAIPQGKLREEANTVYLLITPNKQEMWRGAALSQEEVNLIPHTPFVPLTDMARFGMFKQNDALGGSPAEPKKKPFSLGFGKQ